MYLRLCRWGEKAVENDENAKLFSFENGFFFVILAKFSGSRPVSQPFFPLRAWAGGKGHP
jgi:hypothetical protein